MDGKCAARDDRALDQQHFIPDGFLLRDKTTAPFPGEPNFRAQHECA